MFKATHSFRLLKIQKEEYKKTLDKQLGLIIRQAAREWLREWILNEHPPVETGMARAALRPLGKFLRVAIPISPTRKPYYSQLENTMQSPGQGEKRQRFVIKDDQSHPLRFIYQFSWSTKILHYYLEKYYNGPVSGETKLISADNAFQSYLITRLEKDVPKIRDYIKHG